MAHHWFGDGTNLAPSHALPWKTGGRPGPGTFFLSGENGPHAAAFVKSERERT
jgi:hypothetical protein